MNHLKRTILPIFKILTHWRENIYFKIHHKKLNHLVQSPSPEYRDYLDMQIRRSLSKKDRSLQIRTQQFVDKIASLVDLSTCNVLCIGCRNMNEINYFQKKGAKKTIGIDLYSENAAILVMDMHDMLFPDNEFDLIFSSHSLEHAYDVGKVVSEMVRVARASATISIEAPINFEPRGADRHDFGNLNNLHDLFKPYLNDVLFTEMQAGPTESRLGYMRTIFTINKPQGVHAETS